MAKIIQLCALSEPFVAIHQAVPNDAGVFDIEPAYEAVAALGLVEDEGARDEEPQRWLAPVLAGDRMDVAATQEHGGHIWRVVARSDFESDKAGLLSACIADGKARMERDRKHNQRRKGVVVPALMTQLEAGLFFAGVGLKNGTYVDGALKGLTEAEVNDGLHYLKVTKKIRLTSRGWTRIEPPVQG